MKKLRDQLLSRFFERHRAPHHFQNRRDAEIPHFPWSEPGFFLPDSLFNCLQPKPVVMIFLYLVRDSERNDVLFSPAGKQKHVAVETRVRTEVFSSTLTCTLAAPLVSKTS